MEGLDPRGEKRDSLNHTVDAPGFSNAFIHSCGTQQISSLLKLKLGAGHLKTKCFRLIFLPNSFWTFMYSFLFTLFPSLGNSPSFPLLKQTLKTPFSVKTQIFPLHCIEFADHHQPTKTSASFDLSTNLTDLLLK